MPQLRLRIELGGQSLRNINGAQWIFSWKRLLRLIAVLSLLIAAGWVYFQPGFEPVLAVLGAVVAFITSFFVEDAPLGTTRLPAELTLYDANCGSKGVDLADQRLRVSAAFGPYFTGLLEREQSYVPLSGQIECPTRRGQEGLPPIQRIFWSLQNPKGLGIHSGGRWRYGEKHAGQ